MTTKTPEVKRGSGRLLGNKSLMAAQRALKSLEKHSDSEPTHILIGNKTYPIGSKKAIEKALTNPLAQKIVSENKARKEELELARQYGKGYGIGFSHGKREGHYQGVKDTIITIVVLAGVIGLMWTILG